MAAGNTYTPIQTTTLGSNQGSVTLSSIPSTYTDIILVMSLSTNGAANMQIQFNGSSAANYSDTYISGDGTSATSGRHSNVTNAYCGYFPAADATVSDIISIQNYANTTTYKTAMVDFKNGGTQVIQYINLWRSTAAISSITVSLDSGMSFKTNSSFTLYGIAAA